MNLNQCLYKFLGGDSLQIFKLFARADKRHGNLQFAAKGDNEPALRRTVELGQNNSVQLHRLVEHLGLVYGVAARRRVEYQKLVKVSRRALDRKSVV